MKYSPMLDCNIHQREERVFGMSISPPPETEGPVYNMMIIFSHTTQGIMYYYDIVIFPWRDIIKGQII